MNGCSVEDESTLLSGMIPTVSTYQGSSMNGCSVEDESTLLSGMIPTVSTSGDT